MVRVAKVRMRPDLNHYPPAQFLSHQVNVGSVDTKCTILTPAWHHSYLVPVLETKWRSIAQTIHKQAEAAVTPSTSVNW